MTAIRKHAKEALAVLGLIAVAAGVTLYLLDQQRMRFPWEASPLVLKAEFATAQAVTAGQGQTVRVSGVRVGDIGDVQLKAEGLDQILDVASGDADQQLIDQVAAQVGR